jgi:phosphatidylserine/phosphatidylglycerophosphate/cardiolipin synthase-like enzyme
MRCRAPSLIILLLVAFLAGFTVASFYASSGQYTTRTITTTVTAYTTVTKTVKETVTLGDIQYVCFSRVDDCSSIIVKLIDSAEKYAYGAIYSFTLDSLGDALIRARDRGADVKVVIEREQAEVKGSEYEKLLEAGVDVRLDGNQYLMHHKFMIVDGRIVVTGSYNWSYSAEERNDENLIVISNPDVVRFYEAEFQRVWGQAS